MYFVSIKNQSIICMKKNVLITGASGNLGSSIVKKFIDEGYYVIGIVHQSSTLTALYKENYEEIVLNLLEEEKCLSAVQTIVQQKKILDVAVLTAGGFAMGNIANTNTAAVYKQYQLNFETAYNMARPVFLQMLEQNAGRIFFIGSKAGYDTTKAKGVTAYALSKALLFHVAEIMNDEAKEKNVVTSIVVPSIIDTLPNRKDMPDADFSKWVTPLQIAEAIYFYASEKAAAIREPIIKLYNQS